MAVTPLKALWFAAGGSVAIVGAAYVSGALDPLFKSPPPAQELSAPQAQPQAEQAGQTAQPAAETQAPKTASGTEGRLPAAKAPEGEAMKPAEPQGGAMKPAAEAAANPAPGNEAAATAETPATAAKVIAPTFDVVRVEGNGSMVVAGNAAPNAKVEVVHGATVLGSTMAGPDGTFAIVMDNPLKPGDYQLVLRATTSDNVAATSEQTAVVSVPDKPDGQVLAMVEEPGKPAEFLTMPQPEKKAPAPADAETATSTGAQTQAAPSAAEPAAPAEPQPAPAEQAAQPPATTAPAQTAAPAKAVEGPAVVVEAVEIDGHKIFVAGLADPGRKVRAYANDMLLGDAQTSADGHFLVEATRDLPVGEYTIRVDALDADGASVVARAAVPFQREPGESMAAVAPSAGSATPAETKSANPEPAATGTQPPSSTPAAPETASPPAQAETQAPADGAPAATPAVPETISPKLEHADGAVIIRRGDSLWRISRRVYGHGIRYSTIYLANQDQIRNPDLIWPGQVFKVPEKSREGEAADMKALGDQATNPSSPAPAQQ